LFAVGQGWRPAGQYERTEIFNLRLRHDQVDGLGVCLVEVLEQLDLPLLRANQYRLQIGLLHRRPRLYQFGPLDAFAGR